MIIIKAFGQKKDLIRHWPFYTFETSKCMINPVYDFHVSCNMLWNCLAESKQIQGPFPPSVSHDVMAEDIANSNTLLFLFTDFGKNWHLVKSHAHEHLRRSKNIRQIQAISFACMHQSFLITVPLRAQRAKSFVLYVFHHQNERKFKYQSITNNSCIVQEFLASGAPYLGFWEGAFLDLFLRNLHVYLIKKCIV